MRSSMFAPASRFSKIADTGIRVPFRTHAPLTLPGTLSTTGHCDQSRVAIAEHRLSWLAGNTGFILLPNRGFAKPYVGFLTRSAVRSWGSSGQRPEDKL